MSLSVLPTIQQIEGNNFVWTNINKIGKEEMKYLESTFHFHPLHLEDCLSPAQRPKLDVANDYIFMVLLFPVYNRKTRRVQAAEIDFFINANRLVTVHRNELIPLINFFNLCLISKDERTTFMKNGPAMLIYEILNRLLTSCFPIFDHLSIDVTSIEEHIFRGYERRMVKEILIVKRNIVNFRRIMQIHRAIIKKLIDKSSRYFRDEKLKLYFANLLELTADIQDNLDNLKQSIDALEATNNSLISFRLNDIIKILTVISVVVLPITLITSIFGMNVKQMPLVNSPSGFFIILGIIVVSFVAMFLYVKKRKWL